MDVIINIIWQILFQNSLGFFFEISLLGCLSGSAELGDACYYLISDTLTQTEADYKCLAEYGGHLTSIHSEAEYNHIRAVVS